MIVLVVVIVMIMGVIVGVIMIVVIVIVTQMLERILTRIGLQQLLGRHLPVDRLGLADDVIDHLLLEDRRSELDQRRRILLVILVDELLLAGIAARLLDQRPAQLLLAHLDAGLVADLADDEAEAHASLGY